VASAEVAGTAATSAADLPQPEKVDRTTIQPMRIDGEALFRFICATPRA
jgi:hypothetical protein